MEKEQADILEESLAIGGHGWWLKLKGIDSKIILVALLMIVCFAVASYAWVDNQRLDRESHQTQMDQFKITQTLLSTVISNQSAIIKVVQEHGSQTSSGIDELSYMLTLSQQQKEKLQLTMPISLRRKLNDR